MTEHVVSEERVFFVFMTQIKEFFSTTAMMRILLFFGLPFDTYKA